MKNKINKINKIIKRPMRCDDFASSMTKMDWAPERKKEYEVLSVCL